jgi:hypothetical protein
LQSSDDNFIQVSNITPPSAELGRSIGIDLKDTVKTTINNIQTVQLEPGATPAKNYPAEISGNTVNILPIQSNDTNYIEVVNIVPPSAETGRPIGIDLSASAKSKLDNLQSALDVKSNLNNRTFTGTLTAPTIKGDVARLGNIPTPSSFLSRLEVNGEDALNIYGNGGVGNKVSIYLSSWLDNTYRPVPSTAIQALDNNYSSDLLLCTAPTGDGNSTIQERMRITANGLVGIGTQNLQPCWT